MCPDLAKAAEWLRKPPQFGSTERFVVTAYPVRTSNFPAGTYWIEFDFLMSPFAEWFNNNLTDEMEYKNLWKKGISPQCKDIH